MKRHIKYLSYVLRHKWYVFIECLKLGVPLWIAVFHDWDKFLPDEWFPYVDYFYGDKVAVPNTQISDDITGKLVPKMEVPSDVARRFDLAWLFHQKRNRHHWQFWLLTPDKPRPNFWEQSHDGGMTDSIIASRKGEAVAIVYDVSITWHKPNMQLVHQLVGDLANTPIALEMPDVYRREMLADWRGAGLALGKPDTRAWYNANKDNMVLHPVTRAWIESHIQ